MPLIHLRKRKILIPKPLRVAHWCNTLILHFLTAVKLGKTSLEKLVEKACHNPAILFKIQKRGFLREGFFADLILVDLNQKFTVVKEDLLYQCRWSPFEGTTFGATIIKTFCQWELGVR